MLTAYRYSEERRTHRRSDWSMGQKITAAGLGIYAVTLQTLTFVLALRARG